MTGTVELLPVGSFGVDDSFQPPSLDDMLALGVQFESRYIAIDNALTHDKLWTKDRIRRNADAGILTMVNYEQSQGTTLGGDSGGRKHGPVAGDWRAYLEMPDELPIVVTTDVGVTRSQYSAIADFCAAFSETGGGKIGHYHGTTLCAYLEARGLNDLTWMAMATSWSPGGETAAVHVRQKGYVLGGSCDANYVRQPTPFWNFNGQLDPQEDDMTPEEAAKLIADVAEIKAIVRNLVEPIDPGTTDGSGNPLNTLWTVAHILGELRALAARPNPPGAGVSVEDVKAIVNSTSLKTG